jgi:pimeloyl-ACP methyl ester carboxylesterase
MDALGIANAYVIGWSDGGNVGIEVALKRPDLVRKLVIIGAAAHADGYVRGAHDQLANMTLDQLVALWRVEPSMGVSGLAAITAPTLVLLADDDMVTVEHAAAMAGALPDSQLAVVPGTDHVLLFEKPDLVNRLLLDFCADEQAPKFFAAATAGAHQ